MSESQTFTNTHLGPLEPNIIVDSILFILSIFSGVINLLIAYIIVFRRERKMAVDSYLILIISIFDSIAALFIFSSQISKWSTNYEVISSYLWCQMSFLFYVAASFISLIFTALLSLIRYVIIVKKVAISTNQFLIGLCISVLLLCIYAFVETFAVSHVVMPSGIYCLPGSDSKAATIALKVFTVVFIIPSIFIIPICYLLVISHYRKVTSRYYSSHEQLFKIPFKKRIYNSVIARFVIIILAYLITTAPEIGYFIVASIASLERVALADGIVMTLLFGVTLVNGLFVLTMHEETKELFLGLFGYYSEPYTTSLNIDEYQPSESNVANSVVH